MTDPGPSSAQYSNPRKRPKLEPDEDTDDINVDVDEKPFLNHPTLYFDDGNVILTSGRTLFCVHRSLLSKHSPAFRALFEREHDNFRGLMQIVMEETPEDLEVLLNVIYDGLHLDVQELTVETFPTLAALLRMSKRYQIERPCQDIVACIRAEWPAALAQHDAKETKLNAGRNKELGQPGGDVKPQLNVLENQQSLQRRVVNPLPPQMLPQMLPMQNYGIQLAGNQNQPHPIAIPPPMQQNYPLQARRNMGRGLEAYFGAMYLPQGPGNAAIGGLGVGGGGGGGNAYNPPPRPMPPNAIAGPSNAAGRAPAPAPAAPPLAAAPPPALGAGNSEEDVIVHPASVIGLLRECGYGDAQLLFPLFYALSRTTWQFGGPALGHHLAPLSAADMERLVVGVERIREHHTAFALTVPALNPSPHPPFEPQCQDGVKQFWQGFGSTLLLPAAGRGLAREPLEDLAQLAPTVVAQAARHRVCAACGRALTAKIEAFRRELWGKLPQFFELA